MPTREPAASLLEEAFEMLREADRMHRQFFTVALGRGAPSWEPPIDIVEDERALVVRVALPGVGADSVEVSTDGTHLHVVGVRHLVPATAIHRLEIPYGRFERAIGLPRGNYQIVDRDFVDGCLVLTLQRLP
ncbi:MAG: Hsp20/alpha crystallin family protein [Burkholderiales bacterium]|nr:Hsp20/alpha crystallin family protein [Burkholderiales bacterium]